MSVVDNWLPLEDWGQRARFRISSALSRRQRLRLMRGGFVSGADCAALRRFLGLSQDELARALQVDIDTVKDWERGHQSPRGPELVLLRIAARDPHIIHALLHESM